MHSESWFDPHELAPRQVIQRGRPENLAIGSCGATNDAVEDGLGESNFADERIAPWSLEIST